MSTKQPDLFSTARIGSLELENRLIRSATAERMATEAIGRATPAMAELYRELCRGGVGLIITGHAYVTPGGKAHPEMLGAHCDQMLPGLKTLADAVHAEGGRIALQINHGGRQCDEACTPHTMAPSAVPTPSGRTPREMTHAEIIAAVDAFGQAARRAQQTGFDAVQIHGAHGYLIGQFLSPHTNRRTDAWGGDFARRLRFLAAVCEAVRGQVKKDYPVFIKLGMMDNIARVPDGLTPDDGARIVSRLADLGLDAIEVSGGYGGGQGDFNTRLAVGSKAPEAYFRPLGQRAKAATHLPVILVGGLRSKAVMDDVLTSGDANLISLSRPLICEPDLPNRLRTGEATASDCISGGRCWPKGLGQGISCKQGR
ncbi:MAG: NADH:flavin oxidoreductase [Anaerolineae bacterium]|jgi:2,4-dienoyl-CoA reductase-like NADH-dependent reductase (Old Yellow Enzyme family)